MIVCNVNLFKRFHIVFGLMLFFFNAGIVAHVQAATQEIYFDTGTTTTDLAENISFNKFDPSLGTLTGVTIESAGSVDNSTLVLTNDAANNNTFSYSSSISMILEVLTGSGNFNTVFTNMPLAGTGGLITLPAGASTQNLGPVASTSATATISVAASDLSQFVGTGQNNMTCRTFTGSNMSGGGGNISYVQVTDARCFGKIIYTYTPSSPSQVTDLALIKTVSTTTPGPFQPGDTVTFDITVYNQGGADVSNIQINDYIPAGLSLNDSNNWTESDNLGITKAQLNTPISSLAAGSNATVSITFTVDSDFYGDTIINNAEIASFTGDSDVDSTPGDADGRIPDVLDDDLLATDGSDDYDKAAISVNQPSGIVCSAIDSFIDSGSGTNFFYHILATGENYSTTQTSLLGVIGGSRYLEAVNFSSILTSSINIFDRGYVPYKPSLGYSNGSTLDTFTYFFVRYDANGAGLNLDMSNDSFVRFEIKGDANKTIDLDVIIADYANNVASSTYTYVSGTSTLVDLPLANFANINNLNLSQVKSIEIRLNRADNYGLDVNLVNGIYRCAPSVTPTVSLGSFVWNDANNNGIQDDGESGIAGVIVTLLDSSDNPVPGVNPQSTGADGKYYFQNLLPGDYKVQVDIGGAGNYMPSDNQVSTPNNDVDNDSNIATSYGTIHTSGVITLTVNGEPVEANGRSGDDSDDAEDSSGNMTVDFGFVGESTSPQGQSNSGNNNNGGGGSLASPRQETEVCGDVTAENYSSNGKHNPDLCVYPAQQPEEKKEMQDSKEPVSVVSDAKYETTFNLGICSRAIKSDIGLTAKNDKDDVMTLQNFLNKYENENLLVNGTYDTDTYEAVRRYQEKYKFFILKPWGLSVANGFVGATTRGHINARVRENCQPKKTYSCPYFKKYLQEGSRGDEVVKVQTFLKDLGFYSGPVSGFYDVYTKEAVRAFQNENAKFILMPWGIPCQCGTGYWYKTTLNFANKLIGGDSCAEDMPPLTETSDDVRQCIIKHFPGTSF